MNEVLIVALVARIRAGQMTLEQVPIPYQEAVLTGFRKGDMNGNLLQQDE